MCAEQRWIRKGPTLTPNAVFRDWPCTGPGDMSIQPGSPRPPPITHPPQTVKSISDFFRSLSLAVAGAIDAVTPSRGNRRPCLWIITGVSPGPAGLDQSTPIIALAVGGPAAAADAPEWISKFYVSFADNPTTDRDRRLNESCWPSRPALSDAKLSSLDYGKLCNVFAAGVARDTFGSCRSIFVPALTHNR